MREKERETEDGRGTDLGEKKRKIGRREKEMQWQRGKEDEVRKREKANYEIELKGEKHRTPYTQQREEYLHAICLFLVQNWLFKSIYSSYHCIHIHLGLVSVVLFKLF